MYVIVAFNKEGSVSTVNQEGDNGFVDFDVGRLLGFAAADGKCQDGNESDDVCFHCCKCLIC
jgi:hypothetical protein